MSTFIKTINKKKKWLALDKAATEITNKKKQNKSNICVKP